MKKKFWLSKDAMKIRRQWCLKKKEWAEGDWRNIIWCDEVRIEVSLKSGRLRIRRRGEQHCGHGILSQHFTLAGLV